MDESIQAILWVAFIGIFYFSIRSLTKEQRQKNKDLIKSYKPKQKYEYDLAKYKSKKTMGIVMLIIFFPIGLIILLSNTKPDANAYKDWDNSNKVSRNSISNVDMDNYVSKLNASKSINVPPVVESVHNFTHEDASIKVTKTEDEPIVLTERELAIIKQLRNVEN